MSSQGCDSCDVTPESAYLDPNLDSNYENLKLRIEKLPKETCTVDGPYTITRLSVDGEAIMLPPSKPKFTMDYTDKRCPILLGNFNLLDVTGESLDDKSLELYCTHALNAITQARKRILKNNDTLKSALDTDIRDQGFTRPRILMIMPFKLVAYRVIKMLISRWTSEGSSYTFDNAERLESEFGPTDEDEERISQKFYSSKGENNGGTTGSSNLDGSNLNDGKIKEKMNESYRRDFDGNIDDCFRVGIKLMRKEMKFFSDFYGSDIIVCSPLGLKMVTDGEALTVVTSKTKSVSSKNGTISNKSGTPSKKKRIVKKGDGDFLSSIQHVFILEASVILMQNWDHLSRLIVERPHLCQIPKKNVKCDYSRVMNIFLDNCSNLTLQTIIHSRVTFPELNFLFSSLKNCMGSARRIKSRFNGCLQGPLDVHKTEDKIEYLISILMKGGAMGSISIAERGLAIIVPSYLDYAQVRLEFFKRYMGSIALLHEYASAPEVSRARTAFFKEESPLLLVSERFHFYKRYAIRGVKRIIWFAPPTHEETFMHWSSLCASGPDAKRSICLIKPEDYLAAERLLGSKRVMELFK